MSALIFPNRDGFEAFCRGQSADRGLERTINAVALVELVRHRELLSSQGIRKTDILMERLMDRIASLSGEDTVAARFGESMFIVALHHLESEDSIRQECGELREALQEVLRQYCEEFGAEDFSGMIRIGAARCRHDPEQGYQCAADLALKALQRGTVSGEETVLLEGGTSRRTGVLIVEDQELPRQMLETYIRQSSRYTLVQSIRNADLAYFYCAQGKVQLVIMDVITDMGANGLEASARIKKRYPGIRVIIVTSMPEASWLDRAREAGVDSFWYKDVSEEPLLSIMDRTMDGESVYPDRTPEVRVGEASSYQFTDREMEVLRQLIDGLTNQQISAKLYMSVSTVKEHITNMLGKTGLRSRTELAVRARESGLVIPDRNV